MLLVYDMLIILMTVHAKEIKRKLSGVNRVTSHIPRSKPKRKKGHMYKLINVHERHLLNGLWTKFLTFLDEIREIPKE